LPSRTVAIAPHFQKQMSQVVATVRSPFSLEAAAVACALAEHAVKVAAEICRKRRREQARAVGVSGVIGNRRRRPRFAFTTADEHSYADSAAGASAPNGQGELKSLCREVAD
jgi:hypothetical protein